MPEPRQTDQPKRPFRIRCSLDECENCGSTRNHRPVLKYEELSAHDVVVWCSDCPPKKSKGVPQK